MRWFTVGITVLFWGMIAWFAYHAPAEGDTIVIVQSPSAGGWSLDCDGSEAPYTTNMGGFWISCDANITLNGSDVLEWDGLDSGDNDANQPTAGNQPAYVNEATSTFTASCGHAAFTSTNTDHLLFGSAITSGTEDYTLFAIMRTVDGATSSNTTIVAHASATGTPQWRVDGDSGAGSDNQEFLDSGSASIGAGTAGFDASTTYVIAMRYDDSAGLVEFWVNGASDGSGTNAQNFAGGGINNIGTMNGSSADSWRGGIIAVAIFTEDMSDANVASWNSYMNTLCDVTGIY
jgi:hypothetical protein